MVQVAIGDTPRPLRQLLYGRGDSIRGNNPQRYGKNDAEEAGST
jgi:hypothetical protein